MWGFNFFHKGSSQGEGQALLSSRTSGICWTSKCGNMAQFCQVVSSGTKFFIAYIWIFFLSMFLHTCQFSPSLFGTMAVACLGPTWAPLATGAERCGTLRDSHTNLLIPFRHPTLEAKSKFRMWDNGMRRWRGSRKTSFCVVLLIGNPLRRTWITPLVSLLQGPGGGMTWYLNAEASPWKMDARARTHEQKQKPIAWCEQIYE